MGSCGIEVDVFQHTTAQTGNAGVEQRGHFLFRQRFQLDHHFGQSICKTTAEARQEGALPDVLVEREDDIKPFNGLAERTEECGKPEGCGFISGKALEIIRDEDDTHQLGDKTEQRLQVLHFQTGRSVNPIRQHPYTPGVFERSGSETEQGIHPERNSAHRKPAALREFLGEPLTEDFKVFPRPMRGHGIRVMKIKSFDRPGAQGAQGPFPILARHLAGTDERLQRGREQTPCQQIQNRQAAGSGQLPHQTAQRVIRHRSSVDPATERRLHRDELGERPQLVLDP